MHQIVERTLRNAFVMSLLGVFGVSPLCLQAADAVSRRKLPNTVSFNAHIRPIMSNTCFACHGPDEKVNDSGLRLDSYEFATDSAIVPGKSEESDVYQRLVDLDDPMPPAEFRHKLSDYDKALFKKWIDQGAQYEQHWSYTPLRRPDVPDVGEYSGLVANPIDNFILARLLVDGLSPSPLADKGTLLRRLSLDLIGIPPTPAELDAFLADQSAEAYEHQVDRLLKSPHYGERMAAPWLDIVRFSDTVGYHGDQNQRIFAYRDYVIDAINRNKPFDQFTLEQLAGDLLEDPTPEQLVATGLIRLNMMTREGGAQPAEYLAKYTADRVRMLGTAWLGSTTGCCECHNHKYDPFTTKDFYSLGAFFDDVRQWGVYTTYHYTPNEDLPGFSNDYPFPPELRVQSVSLRDQIASLERELDRAAASNWEPDAPHSESLQRWLTDSQHWVKQYPSGWRSLTPDNIDTEKKTPHKVVGDDVLLTGEPIKGEQTVLTTRVGQRTSVRSIQLEVLPDEANGGFVGRGPDGRFAVRLSASVRRGSTEPDTLEPLKIAFAQANRLSPKGYQSGHDPRFLDSVWRSGPTLWQLPADETRLPHVAVYHLNETLTLGPDDELIVQLTSDDIGKFRVCVSPFSRYVAGAPSVDEVLSAALNATEGELSPQQRDALLAAYDRSITAADQQSAEAIRYRDAILDCRSGMAMTMIAQPLPSDKIPEARVLPRGNWQDRSGAIVRPSIPDFLRGSRLDESTRLTRKDLAEWLTSDENPLVARHFVNRAWKHFFGAGLSGKLDDLGNQGEWPSHPRLLDWLASEFRDGWDMKHITRLIVSSRSYRQSAALPSESASRDLKDIDPYNRLLSQQSARRLEAEIIRDNALAIAGLLNTEFIGGPSVFPYQPEGHYANLQFPDRVYMHDVDARQYRRGVYMHWQRTFLHPMLVNFDAPSRDECVADRTQSNSPQQALTLLNDPTFVETARAMSDRLRGENREADFDQIINQAFRLAVSRSPTDAEKSGLRQLFHAQLEYFAANPDEAAAFSRTGLHATSTKDSDDAVKHAAWSQVCRVILNLHETITRY